MQTVDYEKAVDTLSILVTGLGAGVAAWGVINMIEAYEEQAAAKEVKAEYRRQNSEISQLLEQLIDNHDSGKISTAEYQRIFAEYETEQTALLEEMRELDAAIDAHKKQGLNQIMQGAGFAAAAPIVRSLDID